MPSRHCTQCGAEVAADDKFCTVCGAAVDQTAAAAATTPPVQAAQASQPRSKLPVIALSLLGLIVVAAVAFGVYRATSNTAPSAEEIVATQAAEGLPYPEVLRVSATEAKALFDADAAIFVDVRDPESYAAAHVPGAIALPLTELETGHGQLPQNAEIITYCTWPSEETSARAASNLMQLGYTNVKAIRGGLGAWQEAGYPLSQGE